MAKRIASGERRDFLKGTGLVLAGAAASSLLARTGQAAAPASANPSAGGRPPLPAGNFLLTIDSRLFDGNVESITMEDLVIDAREVAGAVEERALEPGQVHVGRVTIRAEVGSSRELYQWWLDCTQGRTRGRRMSMIAEDRSRGAARIFHFEGAVPVRYDPGSFAQQPGARVESLTVQPDRVEILAVGEADQPRQTRFEVTIDDGKEAETDRLWDEARPGVLAVEAPPRPDGTPGTCDTTTPGHELVEEVSLRGPLTAGRKALCQWITETVQGREWRRNLTLTEIGPDGSPGRSFHYFDCFPTRYIFPSLSSEPGATLTEKICVRVNRIEIA